MRLDPKWPGQLLPQVGKHILRSGYLREFTHSESGPDLAGLKISFVSGSGVNLPQGTASHRTN